MYLDDIFSNLPPLATPRLMLRRISWHDAPDVFAYASDPEVARYTTWEAHRSLDESRDFISYILDLYMNGQVAPWGVILKTSHKLIGTCGFVAWNVTHARAEIGYALGRAYWGQGLMTEAAREVVEFGFERLDLNRIEARCEVPNVASARVMEKLGMSYEGTLREQMYTKGRFCDLKLYSILRREWTPRRP